MGKLKFCANISWLYKEIPLTDRYQAAADSGFAGVEANFLSEFPLSELIKNKDNAGIEHILLNSGSAKSGGNAGNDLNPQLFRDELELAISYASGLDCKKIHIVAGNIPVNKTKQHAQAIFVENLRYAASKLDSFGITGLIEPLNSYSFPNYVHSTSHEAIHLLKLIDRRNILYQLDFFHLQLMEGNITNVIKNNLKSIGHIQVSQVPNRNEPSASGELQYSYIFNLLEELGYDGWIGCEYTPTTSTDISLTWFNDYIQK